MNNYYMNEAYKLACKAYKKKEVPIGAIIVHKNKIIGKGYNQVETKLDSTRHAEIIAIKQAQKKLKNWRLNNCTLYVTLEPCIMCTGAIIQSRIKNVVYALDSNYLNLEEKNLLKTIYGKNKIEKQQVTEYRKIELLLKTFFNEKRKQ